MVWIMDLQLGVLPEMDQEAPGLFTASERIIQDFASEKKVDATFIKDLIQKCYTTQTLIQMTWITPCTSS